MELSGKELSRGEADASSFPPAVCGPPLRPGATPLGILPVMPLSRIKPYISPRYSAPTAARCWIRRLPLLRSMSRLDQQSLRILRLFGNTEAKHVIPR